MRSVWDKDVVGGEIGELSIRLRSCPRGVTVTARNRWSGHLVCARLIHWFDIYDLSYGERMNIMTALFRKPEGVVAGGRLQGAPDDEKFSKKWPTLCSYLTTDCWPDGETRERGTVLLCVDGPVFKACLIEKGLNLTLWATATTFLGALEALEGRLGEDKPDWRPNKGKKGK